jgi:hypothetical protein
MNEIFWVAFEDEALRLDKFANMGKVREAMATDGSSYEEAMSKVYPGSATPGPYWPNVLPAYDKALRKAYPDWDDAQVGEAVSAYREGRENPGDRLSKRAAPSSQASAPGKGAVDSKAGPSARARAHRAAAKRLLNLTRG